MLFEPVQGSFLNEADTAETRARSLFPLLAGAFRIRGYLPQPDDSPLRDLWDDHAPFRLTTIIEESLGPNYFQSLHRTTRIEVHLALTRPPDPTILWQTRIAARTRVPSPRMNAFTSGYIGVSTSRDPEVERILYEDARAHLIEQVPQKLSTLKKL